MDANAQDATVVDAVAAYEEYAAYQQQAADLLKQGFLKLTMSRMTLGNAISDLSYKDEFEAALYVTEERDHSLTLSRGPVETKHAGDDGETDENAEQESTLIRRKRTGSDVQEERPRRSSTSLEDAAIMWFSSLPPQNLRLAQKHFRSGLHALVSAAMAARQVLESTSTLNTNTPQNPAQ
ncbi:hypothetical protein Poli38472_001411 [Pythium oligandrum]|uniref:Vacuolar ATPase assembly protein VMA22 n=1 Tax=Pythium oligandrum TaxID=41045 RepID=A0A8K1FMD7_PYTOL|nr:hypothetical protein Poli38472_001411 [Pythium oligandrum]|eukprot:TMW69255.1 hypothetical protein Poli38472_001411 [Pythium oligandrum]